MPGSDTTDAPACAWCQGQGNSACKGCLLVVYCGRECQKAHWDEHKKACKSPYMKVTWQPQWAIDNRKPEFLFEPLPKIRFMSHGASLWGDVPAIDVLRLTDNEGADYGGDLHLLFAASGDARNVVKTLSSVPSEYRGSLSLVIHDTDFDIVVRNVIILLVALVVEDEAEAVDCILHIWYSAMIRQDHADILTARIRPLISTFVDGLEMDISGKNVGKTWTFGSRSLRVELPKMQWWALLAYLEVPSGLTRDSAREVRTRVTLAEEHQDYRDRIMLSQLPPHRVCANAFREDGILLPFGRSRMGFDIPNPTLFWASAWPVEISSDPLHGWDLPQVLGTRSGGATNDIYGKLYYYLKNVFASFHRVLSSRKTHLHLLQSPTEDLAKCLQKGTFARVEICSDAARTLMDAITMVLSNASDKDIGNAATGTARTLRRLGPLLQRPNVNPHATLLTLHKNAVSEVKDEVKNEHEVDRVMRYMPLFGMPRGEFDPAMTLILQALPLVRDVDKNFNHYMRKHKFNEIEKSVGMTMKETHTIVDKWPMRLKLQPHQSGAQDEFKTALSSGHSGEERYVEWKRKV